jgi:hypothetical protein
MGWSARSSRTACSATSIHAAVFPTSTGSTTARAKIISVFVRRSSNRSIVQRKLEVEKCCCARRTSATCCATTTFSFCGPTGTSYPYASSGTTMDSSSDNLGARGTTINSSTSASSNGSASICSTPARTAERRLGRQLQSGRTKDFAGRTASKRA